MSETPPDDDRAQLIATIVYRGDTEEIEYVYPGEEGAVASETHRQRDGLFPPECSCGREWPCSVIEREAMQDDLAALLRALGLGDHARPETPHAVMLEAIAEVEFLKGALRSWAQGERGYQCAACYILAHVLEKGGKP